MRTWPAVPTTLVMLEQRANERSARLCRWQPRSRLSAPTALGAITAAKDSQARSISRPSRSRPAQWCTSSCVVVPPGADVTSTMAANNASTSVDRLTSARQNHRSGPPGSRSWARPAECWTGAGRDSAGRGSISSAAQAAGSAGGCRPTRNRAERWWPAAPEASIRRQISLPTPPKAPVINTAWFSPELAALFPKSGG